MEDFTGLLDFWIDNVDDPALLAELEQLKTGDETAVRDAFYQDLTFGTAGLRGIIGAGPNRMNVYPALLAELEQLKTGDETAVRDAFYQDLTFGTAGLRGIIGAGPNRMNVCTVAKATQGLADYINANFTDPSVAIARDSRNMGEEFVETAAGVLAANGSSSKPQRVCWRPTASARSSTRASSPRRR